MGKFDCRPRSVLITPVTFQESGRGPSNVPNEKLNQTAHDSHSTLGESDAGNEGGPGAITQLYPESTTGSAVDGNHGNVVPTGTRRDQGPAALGIGTSTVVIGSIEHENYSSGECFRSHDYKSMFIRRLTRQQRMLTTVKRVIESQRRPRVVRFDTMMVSVIF